MKFLEKKHSKFFRMLNSPRMVSPLYFEERDY
jgi:hypothetical protein